MLNWKQGKGEYGKNTHAALGGKPAGGRYVISLGGKLPGHGYCVDVSYCADGGRGSLSTINASRIPKLEDAKALAELHRDKRRELIRKYGDKRNVPPEAWMKFRSELQAWQETQLARPKNPPPSPSRRPIPETATATIDDAVTLLKANGYRVTKPRPKTKRKDRILDLNAVGKPYSPQYDPNYKMKYRTSTAHLRCPYSKEMRFVGDNSNKPVA
jgi:hypothetical protein